MFLREAKTDDLNLFSTWYLATMSSQVIMADHSQQVGQDCITQITDLFDKKVWYSKIVMMVQRVPPTLSRDVQDTTLTIQN